MCDHAGNFVGILGLVDQPAKDIHASAGQGYGIGFVTAHDIRLQGYGKGRSGFEPLHELVERVAPRDFRGGDAAFERGGALARIEHAAHLRIDCVA